MKRKPREPAWLHWPDSPTREPLSSCQPPRAACPSRLRFSDPRACLTFESRLLSLVLRLGTHCACFHGHWEALRAMCFKGNLSPPGARAACPRRPHNERLLRARPLTPAARREGSLPSAQSGSAAACVCACAGLACPGRLGWDAEITGWGEFGEPFGS